MSEKPASLTLPPCPLCGGQATRMSGGGVCCQSDRYCELNEGDGLYFSETSWRKLAATAASVPGAVVSLPPAPAPKCAKCRFPEDDLIHSDEYRLVDTDGHLFAPAPAPAPSERTQRIREDQKKGTGEVTAVMVSPDKPASLCAKCGDPESVGHEFGFRDHAFVCPRCGEKDSHADGCAPAPPAVLTPRDKLAEFGAAILDAYTDDWRLYLDDGDIYDTATACGVIVQRAEKHPPEEECEACAEFDEPCCEVPPEISRAIAALLREGK